MQTGEVKFTPILSNMHHFDAEVEITPYFEKNITQIEVSSMFKNSKNRSLTLDGIL
jgi:hypothetical protein